MAATRSDQDGIPHITGAELLEASFVSVPSNREAAILAVKSAQPPKIPAATDPENPAAAPAAADSPADVPVGQVYAAVARAQAALLTTQ
jgi:hypothetical protein